jgi:hypothetical protein
MAQDAQVIIPKAQLPECQVGEVLTIVGEDEENFILEPQYEEEGSGEDELPAAVKAVME